MKFFAPAYLWWLALAVPIVLAYFYRTRRRRVVVPYLPFWDEVTQRTRRRFAILKIQDAAQLAVNLLIVALIVFALAEGHIEGVTRRPVQHWVVFDTSASMQAEGRRERAIAYLEEYVSKSVGAGDEMMLVGTAGWAIPLARDVGSASRVLRELPGGVYPELGLAAVLRVLGGRGRVLVLTDGQDAATPPDAVTVGQDVPNVAFVDLRVDSQSSIVEATVANFSDQERRVTVNIQGAQRAVTLGPRAEEKVFERVQPGTLKVFLQEADAFSLDNACYAVVERRARPKVAVVYAQALNHFLAQALRVFWEEGVIESTAAFQVGDAARVPEDAIVVYDHVAPPREPPPRVLVFGGPGARVVENPTVLTGNFSVRVSAVFDEGEPMLQALEGSLAVFRRRGDRSRIDIGFRLDDTDIQLTPWFPMLLRTAIDRLDRARTFPEAVPLGRPVCNLYPLDSETVEVTFADRIKLSQRVAVREGWVAISNHVSPGVFQIGSEQVTSNFFDRDESDLRPKVKTRTPAPEPLPWTAKVPLTAWAAGIALLLSVAEWGIYHRKG